MKKSIINLGILLIPFSAFSQVGINTTTPAATLDVISKNTRGASKNVDGLVVPRVDRQRAQSMTNIPTSTIIYVNDITTGTQTGNAVNISSQNFYYFDGTLWQRVITPTAADKIFAVATKNATQIVSEGSGHHMANNNRRQLKLY